MYLVTGGCGFIGSHVVDLLIQKGHTVRVLDDLSNSSQANLSKKAELIVGSITDKDIWGRALKGVKGIFHLAARVSVQESVLKWYQNHLVNCSATINLFENAKGIPIIFASSAAIYGDSPHNPHQESQKPAPITPYAVDKFACELHAQIAWNLHRTPSISFRFFNVYGPRQNPNSPYSGVISKFTDLITHEKPITIYGDGSQQRDFIYVEDIASILVTSMEASFEGASIYNLCTGKTSSINDLADLIAKLAGKKITKEYAPPRSGDILISSGDPSKLLRERGCLAKTSLEEGLKNLF